MSAQNDYPVAAFLYDGEFPLSFLRGMERVGAGENPGECAVTSPGAVRTFARGEWIVRYQSGILSAREDCPDFFQVAS